MKYLAKQSKKIALFFIMVIAGELISPLTVFALTGGPTQPEVQSFSPVSSSDMVDLFTGDFNYNIPLMDVDGYPINISYSGGVTMDQEASWVGLGWNLNPGVINRNMRGIPDDFKGDEIKSVISMKPNITYTTGVGLKPEFFGFEFKKLEANVSLNASLHYNNYRGLGFDFGINPQIQNQGGNLSAGLGLNFSTSDGFSADVSANAGVYDKQVEDDLEKTSGASISASAGYNSRGGMKSLNFGFDVSATQKQKYKIGDKDANWRSGGSHELMGYNLTFGSQTYSPSISTNSQSKTFSYNFGMGPEFVGANAKISGRGSVSTTEYFGEQTKPSFGYFFLEKKENNDVLLDFNRERDGAFIETQAYLPLPIGTYDIFSVSAQGIGGSFRTFRNDFPMFHDDEKKQNYRKKGDKAKLIQTSLGIEFGATKTLKLGLNLNMVFNKTRSGLWDDNNNEFKEKFNVISTANNNDPLFEPAYFKMTGEFSPLKSATINHVGNKNLASPVSGLNYLSPNLKEHTSIVKNTSYNYKNTNANYGKIHYNDREKRNKLISFLNAEEASFAGLDKYINYLNVGQETTPGDLNSLTRVNNSRKAHHISEITVTSEDGQRFVYGIPAYNNKYIEKSFAITPTSGTAEIYPETGQVKYQSDDDSENNKKGIDWYFSSKETPPYSHSFLLTAILSPDYVDVQNDGISDDDIGSATKFNYRLPHTNYKWRIPIKEKRANYQEGIKSSTLDDKASYIYGEKEIWHLREVEGKNHIAVFELGIRHDGLGVKGEDGDTSHAMRSYMLKKITLYSKNDYRINGSNAYPIKTVNFVYDYSVCPNVENNDCINETVNGVNINANRGKLTLKSIYFTYGKSFKGRLSPYVFNYSSVNPAYNLKGNDRWGNFKPNRGDNSVNGMPNNAEYSFTIQNKDSADIYSSAWSLTEIVLPSGGKIQVTYESDDYAYVQDKKAMHMFKIEGFSKTYNGSKSESNYLFDNANPKEPVKYAYFKLDKQISGSNKDAIFRKQYLEGLDDIQFDLLARVSNAKSERYEFVKVYTEIDISKSGVTNDGLYGYLYMEPKAILMRKEDNANVKKLVNPLAKGIWQYIRNIVPHEIYPFSDKNRNYTDESKFRQVISSMATAFSKMSKIFYGGLERHMFNLGYGAKVKLNKSWVRLNDPDGIKYGGGQRVKRITMNDNWAAMTQDVSSENQTYGQEYVYQTRDTVENRIISSGVAAWEPAIGGDENPFKKPISTIEELKMAPDLIHTTDEPIGESYAPAPVVGYSKIKTIPLIPDGIIKQKTGYTITKFYTSKDYPFRVITNEISKAKIEPSLYAFFEKKIFNTTVSQGYLVETNDMHGKPKGEEIYNSHGTMLSGSENIYSFDVNDPSKLNNMVKAVKNNGETQNTELGITVDFYSDTRENTASTYSGAINFNTDIFRVATMIIPIITLFSIPTAEDRIFRSAVVVKHINRIGILKKTIAYQEGASIVTENLLYDYETGNVLLTSVQNEFHDNIFNFTYPAHWAYDKGMGQGYKNIGLVLNGIKFNSINNYVPTLSSQNLNQYLVPGDECILKNLVTEEQKVVHAYWGTDNQINLIDADGKAIFDNTNQEYTLKVIRSGRRNMQSTPIGALTTLKNPIQSNYLLFDSILNSSASVYSDVHKVFCNEIGYKEWDCENTFGLTGALNIILLTNYFNGGEFYSTNTDTLDNYTVGLFKKNITPHELYDSSALMRRYFDDTCRQKSGNPSYFNDTLNYSYYNGMNHYIQYYSFVSQNKKVKYRNLFNSSTDIYWKASLGNIFKLSYIVFTHSCHCPNLGVDINLFTKNIIAFKDILRFKNLRPFKDTLISGCNNINNQFKITAEMNNNSYVDFVGFSNCPTFEIKCTPYCVEAPYSSMINPYRFGLKGNWRKVKDYAFSGDRKYNIAKSSPKRDGIYDNEQYTNFWKKESSAIPETGSYYAADLSNNRWVWTNEVTIYSPYGPELENKNALNIYSSAIYGFRHTLPLAVASNAKYKQIGYEGFEDASGGIDCEKAHFSFMTNLGANSVLDKSVKHTGKTSLKVKKEHSEVLEISLPDNTSEEFNKENDHYYLKSKTDCIGSFIPDSGYYIIGAWLKDSVNIRDTSYLEPEITVEIVKGGNTNTYHLKASGLIIEGWQRIEGRFKIPDGATIVRVKLKAAEENCTWFDDIRVHPVSGNMKSYAYDPVTLRLMADMDENNYASFYEYDLEGNLARLKRETERGIMTIKETKSSIKGNK